MGALRKLTQCPNVFIPETKYKVSNSIFCVKHIKNSNIEFAIQILAMTQFVLIEDFCEMSNGDLCNHHLVAFEKTETSQQTTYNSIKRISFLVKCVSYSCC